MGQPLYTKITYVILYNENYIYFSEGIFLGIPKHLYIKNNYCYIVNYNT